MSLCLAAGGKVTLLALSSFTLIWTHSVEKVDWQEDWQVTQNGLVLSEARVKGSGAGMDPPEGAQFDGTWWRYRPRLDPLPELTLARSGATISGWRFCAGEQCRPIDDLVAGQGPVTLRACTGQPDQ